MVSADGIDPNFSTTREVMSSVPPKNTSGSAGGVVDAGGVVGVGASVGGGDGEASGVGEPVVGVGVAGTGVLTTSVGAGVPDAGVAAVSVEVGRAVSDGNTACSVPPQLTASKTTATMPRIDSQNRNLKVLVRPRPHHEGI